MRTGIAFREPRGHDGDLMSAPHQMLRNLLHDFLHAALTGMIKLASENKAHFKHLQL